MKNFACTLGKYTALTLFAASFLLAGQAGGGVNPTMEIPQRIPFSPGEKLTFELKWLFLPAGTATIEILPIELMDGEPAWHFVLKARTNRFTDAFYKVRDRIDTYVDLNMTRTLYYKKIQREGDTKRDVEVIFDWENLKASYVQDGNKEKETEINPESFDPLSVVYKFRSGDIALERQMQAWVTDGKKCVEGRAFITKEQSLAVPAGRYETFVMEPELKHAGGVFQESKNPSLRIWFSKGPERQIIKIRGKVAVGSFSANLVKVEKLPPHLLDQDIPEED
ncbi:Protein of unknown function [Desulfatibacillum alkenivorans DSM 16219]|jgi:hypothetical protein|uniref:DUF3108 domain-containing protein n=1 Tax=Desulfatibacillum alkenivorans DSM 16219 TaxID=1121393 RepID=A0A1M6J8T4_9BACT|nr:DUF3108 domain-containing protein [Desulfatibacillum alkenivorans]SHJ43087.1 Protein of unknown function [Desulfatibacillum alkenivorans DSM 16219]